MSSEIGQEVNKKGRLVILSGPSGSGKTSICKILTKNTKVKQSVSYTTRKPRDGERDGRDYCFIAKSEFEKLIDENKLVEHAEYCGFLYGTPIDPIKKAINSGMIFILAIDVKGALQIMKKMSEITSIFLTVRDDKTLRQRLENRYTDDADINERLKVAKKEMEHGKYYDYCVINDRLDDAVKEIEGILNLS